jgi:predicted transposase/invertase (TIGR01784 family)
MQGIRGGRLDPKLDIVFWMLFGAEQNRALLISLLNAVLQPSVPIAWAEVERAEPERLGVAEKSIALDVRVRLENGEQIDVEMQTQRHPALRERALYYWGAPVRRPTAMRRGIHGLASVGRHLDHEL